MEIQKFNEGCRTPWKTNGRQIGKKDGKKLISMSFKSVFHNLEVS